MSRINYYKEAPDAINKLASVNTYLEHSGLDPKLRALLEIRISQINGCAYCVDLHTQQARKVGVEQRKLDLLPVWDEAPSFFTAAEQAALSWVQSVTHIADTHAPDDLYEELEAHFSAREIVDITLVASIMNAWNRLSISFRKEPA